MMMHGRQPPRAQTQEEMDSECCTSCPAKFFCTHWAILMHDGCGRECCAAFWFNVLLGNFIWGIGGIVYAFAVWEPQKGIPWYKGGLTKKEYERELRDYNCMVALPIVGYGAVAPPPMMAAYNPPHPPNFGQGPPPPLMMHQHQPHPPQLRPSAPPPPQHPPQLPQGSPQHPTQFLPQGAPPAPEILSADAANELLAAFDCAPKFNQPAPQPMSAQQQLQQQQQQQQPHR